MTGKQLYLKSVALMMETEQSASDYEQMAIPIINTCIAECFEVNNGILAHDGKDRLTEIPTITELADEVNMEQSLLLFAIPYGICAKFLIDDNDLNKVAYFQNAYIGGMQDCRKVSYEDIEDYYGGDVM